MSGEKSFDVDFESVSTGASKGAETRRSTPVAGIVNQRGDEYREQRSEEIHILVDPKRTKMWKFADRTESDEELDISDLILSMAPDKEQRVPALARKLNGDPNFDYELIFGRRRRAACMHHGRKLKIVLTDKDDKACLAEMKFENDDRKDITPMQKARSYYIQFNGGESLYRSMREMSENLAVPQKTLQRMIKAGELWVDEFALKAIGRFKDVGLYDAEELMILKEQNPASYSTVMQQIMDDEEHKNKSPSGKVKFAIKAIRDVKRANFEKFYPTDSGSVKVKTDANGDVTLKLPKDFITMNREKIFDLFKMIRADLGE